MVELFPLKVHYLEKGILCTLQFSSQYMVCITKVANFHMHTHEILYEVFIIFTKIHAEKVRIWCVGMGEHTDFLQYLSTHVLYIFSMICFYTVSIRPGPNSPIAWVQRCIELISPSPNPKERGKILMGLNFYGTHYIVGTKVEPILGLQWVFAITLKLFLKFILKLFLIITFFVCLFKVLKTYCCLS